jgi:hypothetical protein
MPAGETGATRRTSITVDLTITIITRYQNKMANDSTRDRFTNQTKGDLFDWVLGEQRHMRCSSLKAGIRIIACSIGLGILDKPNAVFAAKSVPLGCMSPYVGLSN